MSKWESPIVIVPKKSAPGEAPKRRLCIDFRKVNKLQQEVITAGKTKGQISIHPLPKIDEMYAKLKGTKVFSTIDLRSGYHHIALGKSLRAKTAFVMPFGKYEFLMVPFGLAQAPAYFQLLMNKVLKGLKFTMTYLDDIIIFSQDESQHLEHLEIVFSHLREAGLKMKCSKCDFFKSEIHYLGHLISPEGISPLPNKLDSIKHMPAPNSAKEIKQFLGLTGYYRKFVPRFADISRPLTTLTKKDAKFEWTSACQKSFEQLKEALCGEPVLKYADTSKPYTLYTDASKYSWAGVLTQPHVMTVDGKSITTDHPVAFVSGLFRGSQLNWAALTKEAFAIYMSVKKLLFYLTDAQILLRSDHKPLEKFLLKNTLNSKVNNWAMELEAFNIQFDYIKGSNNILADTLSRLISIDPDTPTMPEEPGYDISPSSLFKPHDLNDEFLGTNNFFMPDGSNRRIHQIHNKVFHAGYLENGNNAYLLELPALVNMLNTRKFLMDEMSGQFYAVYGNSYQRMSTKPMLQQAWATGELIDELAATRQAFRYTGLAGSTPPLATETQPTASTLQQPDDLLPRQLAPKTVQYQPPSFRLTRPTTCLTKNERIQVHHNYISAVSSLEHKKRLN